MIVVMRRLGQGCAAVAGMQERVLKGMPRVGLELPIPCTTAAAAAATSSPAAARAPPPAAASASTKSPAMLLFLQQHGRGGSGSGRAQKGGSWNLRARASLCTPTAAIVHCSLLASCHPVIIITSSSSSSSSSRSACGREGGG
eukprot:1161373-Pelagomonas_calceolata.AAC.7